VYVRLLAASWQNPFEFGTAVRGSARSPWTRPTSCTCPPG